MGGEGGGGGREIFILPWETFIYGEGPFPLVLGKRVLPLKSLPLNVKRLHNAGGSMRRGGKAINNISDLAIKYKSSLCAEQ